MANVVELAGLAGTGMRISPPAGARPAWASRLRAEWELLQRLVALNPERLRKASMDDSTLRVILCGSPALLPGRALWDADAVRTEHRLRVEYPRYFPAVPLELYLDVPTQHPNIHPETGFVCLWDQHRVANNVEHAVHKTAAMLGWRLVNLSPEHVMQVPSARFLAEREGMMESLFAPPLLGVGRDEWNLADVQAGGERRRRLS